MKLILTQDELAAALRDGTPTVLGQQVVSVEIQKNSPTDFAILALSPVGAEPPRQGELAAVTQIGAAP